MVDHEILLQHLETSFGISPLNWFRSYLSDSFQVVVLGDTRSAWIPVQFGVPHGSVLGPLLYVLFTADISRIFLVYLLQLNTLPLATFMLTTSRLMSMIRLRAVRRSVSMPAFKSMVHAFVSGLIIVTPSSMAYQNHAWLHCNLS